MLDYVKALLGVKFGLLIDEDGQGMAEYALILALIAVVVALALPGLATAISGTFTDVAGDM